MNTISTRGVSPISTDRKSTRLNSSHTEIYTLSLHDALPISAATGRDGAALSVQTSVESPYEDEHDLDAGRITYKYRSEEHTSELQSHRDLHSFPTRRSSDLGSNRT